MDLNILKAALSLHRAQSANSARRGFVICLCVAALPSTVLAAWAGFTWGRTLPALDVQITGMVLMCVPAFLALVSGVWDGTCALDVVPFRPFLVRSLDLFWAEMVVGLLTPIKCYFWAIGTAMSLGFALARPTLLPWILPLLVMTMLSLVCLERLVGAALRCLGCNTKLLLLFAGLLWGGRRLIRAAYEDQPILGFALPNFSHGIIAWLPGPCVVSLLNALCAGVSVPFQFMVCTALWILLLLFTTYAVLRRNLIGERTALRSSASSAQSWFFQRPWLGVALERWHRIWNSRIGRLCLFLPILGLTAMFDPLLFQLHLGAAYIVAVMGWMMLPLGVKLTCSLFGFDRGGVRTFWMLPLEDRDLLLGKVAGTAAFQILLIGLLLLTMFFATPMTGVQILSAAFFCAALALAQLRTGLRYSIEHPIPLDPASLNPSELDDDHFRKIGQLLWPWALLVALWTVSSFAGNRCVIITMAVACTMMLIAFWRAIPRACARLAVCREELTLKLERSA